MKDETDLAVANTGQFSEGSECVLDCIRSLGQRQDVRIILIRAEQMEKQKAAGYYLAGIESRLAVRQISSWSVVGSAREEICRVAREQECDLIVLASHGHSGSLAEGVIRAAPCPILLL